MLARMAMNGCFDQKGGRKRRTRRQCANHSRRGRDGQRQWLIVSFCWSAGALPLRLSVQSSLAAMGSVGRHLIRWDRGRPSPSATAVTREIKFL